MNHVMWNNSIRNQPLLAPVEENVFKVCEVPSLDAWTDSFPAKIELQYFQGAGKYYVPCTIQVRTRYCQTGI